MDGGAQASGGRGLETFRNEGTLHESVFLLESRDGPVTAYVMEVEDSEQAREAYRASTLPIDLEHREVIEEVLTDAPPVEGLLDLSMPGGIGLGNRPLSRSALPSSVRYASRR